MICRSMSAVSRIDAFHPERPARDGAWLEPYRSLLRRGQPAQARPSPFFGSADQPRSQRVALDVPQNGQQVLIFLDRKRFEPALPDVTAGPVTPQVAAHVRGHQPMHPAADIAVLARPEREVEMIGHQAVGEDAHRSANARLRHQVEERVVVIGLMEYRRPRVPPIEDVIGVAS